MDWKTEKLVTELYKTWSGSEPEEIQALPPSGSSRQYFRMIRGDVSVIGAFNPDVRENRAFLELSSIFSKMGLPVPEVLARDRDLLCYILQDLGDTTLFSMLPHGRQEGEFDQKIMGHYKRVVELLPRFQVDAAPMIDFDICYPRHSFDRLSMMWDLNYFKYYFLKISGVQFDEQKLEDDFNGFVNHLLELKGDYFMYRDFQSRNIMITAGGPFFIDYQGGRRGPLAYDIASLLFDAKANIPFDQREELLEYYTDCLGKRVKIDGREFRKSFYDMVVMRILQALGTYGFRGGVEKKPLFLQSVPFALRNISWLDDKGLLPQTAPYLSGILRSIALRDPSGILPPPDDSLTVRICSFSYRRGIPADNSGNGGGFVFDCRALPNPGREEKYKALTGLDRDVINYLSSDEGVGRFIDAARAMVEPAVKTYTERGFTSLAVCFGCTGGQHRSVYCAETLARRLREKYRVNVVLQHFEQDNWPGEKQRV